ncbi:MAG: Mu transposase C-terminal domain-containing protein [Actinomycetota bacterium]|nr:Mu transposase C-terminal domain-containing protein [Actinomycetota bacterium]
MSLELFADRFAEWVIQYNTARPHSGLDGQTPLQRWIDDPTPVREVPIEQLRWLLLADVERTINRDGIHFGGHIFIAGELNGLVGERVQIRYTPHDLRQIEVFRADQWLCTARPQGLLSREERDAVLARRRADAAELGRRQRRASRRARAKLAPITTPITDPGQLEDITVVSARADRAHHRGEQRERGERDLEQRDRDLQRLAQTNLLNLHRDFDYWNPPEQASAVELDVDTPSGAVDPGGHG